MERLVDNTKKERLVNSPLQSKRLCEELYGHDFGIVIWSSMIVNMLRLPRVVYG